MPVIPNDTHLHIGSLLFGRLHMVYAPEPPFDSGTPETAPVAILEQARQSVQGITAQREATARRVAARLGITLPAAAAD